MKEEFEVVEVQRICEGFLAVDEAKVRYTDLLGTMGPEMRRRSVERGDSVAILLHDVTRDVLVLARQFRYPLVRHQEPWITELVAGKIDPDESALEAARREAIEEVGIAPQQITLVADVFPSPGGCSERITIYYAAFHGEQVGLGGGVDAGEFIERIEISRTLALEQLKANAFHDAKTVIALQWLGLR